MKRSEFIANRLREVLLNGYWIVHTNYQAACWKLKISIVLTAANAIRRRLEKAVEEFLANSAAFAGEVAQMPDEKLDQVFVNERYGTYLRKLEGVIEHSYYHFGQIVLIKKMI